MLDICDKLGSSVSQTELSKPEVCNLWPYGRMRSWKGILAAMDAYSNLNALAAVY